VEKSLGQLAHRLGPSQADTVPYFQFQFGVLCQYVAYCKSQDFSETSSVISLLAGRPTALLMEYENSSSAWTSLAQVQRMTAAGQQSLELAAIRNIQPVTMLHKLDGISEVPLQSLDLLSTEMTFLGIEIAHLTDTISGDPLLALDHALQSLREQVEAVVIMPLQSEAFESIKSYVDQLPLRLTGQASKKAASEEQVHHLHQCLASAADSSLLHNIRNTSSHASNAFAQASYACIQFFTGCLLLYVPDRAFDPALRPMVERGRHNKRKVEMQNKVQALQDFEMVFSGQPSSFRIQLAEQGLQALGAEPQVPSIVRPQVSDTEQLQAEFDNILKFIAIRSPTSSVLEQVFQGQASRNQEIKLLRANIFQAVTRLSQSFHAYEDIMKPLIAMLQGLDVGLALALLTGASTTASDHSIKRLCTTTPFLGANPYEILKSTPTDVEEKQNPGPNPYSQYLKSFAVARSVSADLGQSPTQSMFQAFHTLYEEWKEKLGHNQQQNAAKSSLYRDRGSEDDSKEADEQDFNQLFSNYSETSGDTARPVGATYDPRVQARGLASLQRQIFQSTEMTSTRIIDLLREASHTIARTWQHSLELSMFPVPNEKLLSAVILSLDECKGRLHYQPTWGKLYNLYTDANLPEAQKLIALVHRIQTRFIDLQHAWPEHVTLDDVLRTSSELLKLRHTEPIAKILTKTEQLHGYIHEWQVVASKQYTAASLYDQLTDLLVSWRRLELSTWARLLDMEDQKCNEDADSWWFIAYESIIAAPLSMIDAGEDLNVHAEHMFSTLSEFLGVTSMGQYSHRLSMIDCFKSHLELLVREFASMCVVHNALVNFLSFYTRFNNPIQVSLRKGRQALEKDMKEILLLASWKDTNIVALRDSAKRSHHKLFKIVRKYRTLLAQPSEIILLQGFPDEPGNFDLSPATTTVAKVAEVDSRALNICQQSISDWPMKRERFTNPCSTADRMLRMSQLPASVVDGTSYLDSYSTELMDSMKSLQKETPSKATKKNAEAIKHLKARKRKLYAETLKDLRQMGFRSNMNADTLSQQASLSAVLTNSPALASKIFTSDVDAAVYYFHKLINAMPQLKEGLRTHSEDLTHGEVARSLGYLESTISVILRQRNVLATAMSDLDHFDEAMRKLRNLWAPDSYVLRKLAHGKDIVEKETQYILKWLPAILEAGSVIAQKYGQMGDSDSSPVVDGLTRWKDKIKGLLNTFSQLAALPVGLSSSQHERTILEAERILEDLKVHLQQLIVDNPGLAFVLKQIELWTIVNVVPDEKHVNGEQVLGLKDFDNCISNISDSILVVIQRMQEACSSLPTSDEDPAWLMRADTCLATSLRRLRTLEIQAMLEDVMSKIHHLDPNGDGGVGVASALCAMAVPIFEQYRNIQQISLGRQLKFHQSLCKLASLLAHSFSQIAQKGFCSPAEDSASEAGKIEKLEGGTGLGEGEGADDISKDIQDDEDLSELAQQKNKDDEEEEIEDQEDAVNMDQDELEGEMGDMSDKGEDDGSASEGNHNDIDEQTGDVDDLDPSAVDERLWDGKTDETEKEKEGSKIKGKAEKDDQAAPDSAEKRENNFEDGDEEEDEISQDGAEEGEGIAKEVTEKMDPRAQDEQNLDLPEEIDLDNAGGTDAEADSGDSDIDALSEVNQAQIEGEKGEEKDEDGRGDEADSMAESLEDQLEENEEDEAKAKDVEESGSPVDTDPSDDEQGDDQGLLQEHSDNAAVDQDNAVPSDVRALGENMGQQQDEEDALTTQAQASKGSKGSSSNQDDPEAAAEDGRLGQSKDRPDGGQAQDETSCTDQQSQVFKKLGDALEKWHRQQKQIQNASEQEMNPEPPTEDSDTTAQDFEHLHHEKAEVDAQAMGAATQEQATALDEKGLDSEMLGEAENFPPEAANQDGAEGQDEAMEDYEVAVKGTEDKQVQPRPGAFVDNKERNSRSDQPDTRGINDEEAIDDLDNDFSTTHLQPTNGLSLRSREEARRLWSHYESITRELSLSLTEQLRLILAPTLATKMHGDFRTGKRLNIKRIIPYIASQYKRDKIWMRRSIPSKRNYQIMLAVDDSKSMGESGSGQLAFETLALVAKSLSMLEVGAICVVGFGNEVQLAHEFDKPFSSEAGAQIFQHFGFQQTKTNVRKLVADSITLFRDARRKTFNAGTGLWQLELIISDGVCDEHDTIRHLVRQAQEERIMIVFVIVDALKKNESILDMSQAVFEPDSRGETKLKIKRYLDDFPFPYYVVVGNLKELPGVLAQALRQWFAEVVESE